MMRKPFILVLSAAAVFAQTFAVSSIKPSTESQAPKGPPPIATDPSRLSIRHQTLREIIAHAYSLQMFQVTGGPSWTDTDRYDIDGATESPASREQMLLMLRSLLARRFQLKFQRENKAIAQPVLTIARNGPKFGPQFHPTQDTAIPPEYRIPLKGYTMEHLAFFLTDNRHMWDPETGDSADPNDSPVLDKTGLTGAYDIGLNWAPRRDWLAEFERQLGLRVEFRKLPTDVIVIESASKPSAN